MLKGLLANLQQPVNAIIPRNVPLIGGQLVGANAGFGVIVMAPLNVGIAPTVSGYGDVKLTAINHTLFERSYDVAHNLITDSYGSFSATPQVILDPKTLQPTDGFGISFSFSGQSKVIEGQLFNATLNLKALKLPININLPVSFDAQIAYNLTAVATVILSPGSGFVFTPGHASITLDMNAVLTGGVSYDIAYSKLKKIGNVQLGGNVYGKITVNSTVDYAGTSSTSPTSTLTHFGGSFEPGVTATITVTLGKRITKKLTSPNLLKLFFKLPVPL